MCILTILNLDCIRNLKLKLKKFCCCKEKEKSEELLNEIEKRETEIDEKVHQLNNELHKLRHDLYRFRKLERVYWSSYDK